MFSANETAVAYDASSTKSWYHADAIGSVVATSDASGSAVTINQYGPYGEPGIVYAGRNQGRIRYTGLPMITEAGTTTGINQILYDYRARIYAPKLGRFLQTDPIGTQDDRNLYAYVGNDPINRTDPTGMFADDLQNVNLLTGEHDYTAGPNLICPASWGCTAQQIGQVYSTVRNSIPGNENAEIVVTGHTYPVYVGGAFIGYVDSYVGAGGLTVSNVTRPSHALYDGWINRNAFQDKNGNWYSVTHGSGTNYYGGFFNAAGNQIFGPRLFNSMDRAIADQLYQITH